MSDHACVSLNGRVDYSAWLIANLLVTPQQLAGPHSLPELAKNVGAAFIRYLQQSPPSQHAALSQQLKTVAA
jgi:hypothetical protein